MALREIHFTNLNGKVQNDISTRLYWNVTYALFYGEWVKLVISNHWLCTISSWQDSLTKAACKPNLVGSYMQCYLRNCFYVFAHRDLIVLCALKYGVIIIIKVMYQHAGSMPSGNYQVISLRQVGRQKAKVCHLQTCQVVKFPVFCMKNCPKYRNMIFLILVLFTKKRLQK